MKGANASFQVFRGVLKKDEIEQESICDPNPNAEVEGWKLTA
jgi:hypothetical protein